MSAKIKVQRKPSNARAKRVADALLAWFAASARDLPWRRTRDPYAIWVSEIMLQQTQVKTVIPYWERWLRELPTIAALAAAAPEKIHKLWEGLGYYTRVRNMQKAAQQIIASCRRRGDETRTKRRLAPPHVVSYKFPENFDDILALPGIGRYTAGAIASIAFNQPVPILDGNVIRVLTRLHGIAENPREKKTNARLWTLAEKLVKQAAHQSPSRSSRREEAHIRNGQSLLTPAATNENACSHLNQSLMELGALVCTPRSPQCEVCPVNKFCVARKQNLQEQLPNLGKREAATVQRFIAFVVERRGKFLVRQRPAGVVNAHLWEFPNVEVGEGGAHAITALVRSSAFTRSGAVVGPNRLNAELQTAATHGCTKPYHPDDFRITAPEPLCIIKHSITRYRITLEAWRAKLTNSSAKIAGVWLTRRQLHQLAFTSAHRKILLVANVEQSRIIPRARCRRI